MINLRPRDADLIDIAEMAPGHAIGVG